MADGYDDFLAEQNGGGAVATTDDDSYEEFKRQQRQAALAKQRADQRTPSPAPVQPAALAALGLTALPNAPTPALGRGASGTWSTPAPTMAPRDVTATPATDQGGPGLVSRLGLEAESPSSFGDVVRNPGSALAGAASTILGFVADQRNIVTHPVETAKALGTAAVTAPYRLLHGIGGMESAGLEAAGADLPVDANFAPSAREAAGGAFDISMLTAPALEGGIKLAGAGRDAAFAAAEGEARFQSALERAKSDAQAARARRSAPSPATGQGGPLALPPGQYDLPAGDFSTREQPETDPTRLIPASTVGGGVPTETGSTPTAPIGMPAVDWENPLAKTKADAAQASAERQQSLGLPRALLNPSVEEVEGGARAAEVSAFNIENRASPQDVETYKAMRDAGVGTPGREVGSPTMLPGESYDDFAQRVMKRKDIGDAAIERNAMAEENATPADVEAEARSKGQYSTATTKGGALRSIEQFPKLTDDALHAHMADLIDNRLGVNRGGAQNSLTARLNAAEAELESRGHSTEDIWTSGLEKGRTINDPNYGVGGPKGFTAAGPLGMIIGAGSGALVGAAVAEPGQRGEGAVAGAVGALGLVAVGARLARDGGEVETAASKAARAAEAARADAGYPSRTIPKVFEGKVSPRVIEPRNPFDLTSEELHTPVSSEDWKNEFAPSRQRRGALGDQVDPAAEGLRKKAVKEFGTTNDTREAGWLLPDGQMLDFSGKKDGGPAGERAMDHREIQAVYPDDGPSHTAAMNDFRTKGNVRFHAYGDRGSGLPNHVSVDLTQGTLTEPQFRRIKEAMRGNPSLAVDLRTPEGEWLKDHGHEAGDGDAQDLREWMIDNDAFKEPGRPRYGAIGDQPTGAADDVGAGKSFPERLYSRSQRAIEQAPFKKGTADQWRAVLEKNVGQDERKALLPFLDAYDGESISKAQMLEEHAKTRIKLGEKTFGGGAYNNGADPEGDEIHAQELTDAHVARVHATGDAMRDAHRVLEAHGVDQVRRANVVTRIAEGRDPESARAHYQLPDTPEVRDALTAVHDAGQEERVAQSAAQEHAQTRTTEQPKYASYTEPGGTNYREHVITLDKPEAEATETREQLNHIVATTQDQAELTRAQRALQGRRADVYESPHWNGVDNPLVHVRLSDRELPSGEKALHVEELQSDWHQQGRKQGYKSPPDELRNKAYSDPSEARKVPDAPFKKTQDWAELGLKKVIDEAVRGKYDRVTLASGEQQARRYDLSKQIDELRYDPETNALSAKKDGHEVHSGTYDPKALADVVGKEAAEKLLASPKTPSKWLNGHGTMLYPGDLRAALRTVEDLKKDEVAGYGGKFDDEANTKAIEQLRGLNPRDSDESVHAAVESLSPDVQEYLQRQHLLSREPEAHELKGQELAIGGEGMKSFYDKMLPNTIKDYAKKLGVKMELEPVDLGSGRPLEPDEIRTHADEIRHERGGSDRHNIRVSAVLNHVAEWLEGPSRDWRAGLADYKESVPGVTPKVMDEAERALESLEKASADSGATLTADEISNIGNRMGTPNPVQDVMNDVFMALHEGMTHSWRDALELVEDNGMHSPGALQQTREILEEEQAKRTPGANEKNLSFKVTPELRAKVLKEGQRIGAVDPKIVKTLGLSALGGLAGSATGATPDERKRNAILGLLGGAGAGALLSREAKVLSAGEKAELGADISGARAKASARAGGDAIVATFAPASRGPEAAQTAQGLRAARGRMEHEVAVAQTTLDRVAGDLNKKPIAKKLGFVDAIEHGAQQPDKAQQPVANSIRRTLDTERDKIRALGTGKLENFIEDYFPHLWQDPEAAKNWLAQIMGKKPFEGSKAFLKKREIPTVLEGMFPEGVPKNLDTMTNAEVLAENKRQGGLVPVTFNPVEATMLKLREMKKYRQAQEVIKDLDTRGLLTSLGDNTRMPVGYARIGDWAFTNKAAPEPVARVLNNYFSPGLRGNAAFDAYMAIGNTLNQGQLGLSAFHAGMTTIEAMVSHNALTLEKLFQGKGGEALRRFATSGAGLLAPIENYKRGNELLRAYYQPPGTVSGPLGTILDGMAEGGGRPRMEGFDRATTAFQNAREAKQYGRMAKQFLPALLENTTGLVMNELVPRQKLGVFYDLAKSELEKLGPEAHPDAVTAAMQKAWDSVDNRMGSLVYDNLFWNKAAKDVLHASVRSVGWNWGTFRELGGGAADLTGFMKDLVTGKGKSAELSHRAAYAMALPMTTALLGAVTQYLYTGKGPDTLFDYFHPKTGTKDSDGNDNRVVLPTYMKDVYSYAQHPVRTLTNKMNPLLSMMGDMLANKNFYGDEIYDEPDFQHGFVKALDSSAKAAGQATKFATKEALPFFLQNVSEGRKRGEGVKDLAPAFVGITPASREAVRSKAQNIMASYYARTKPEQTPEDAEASRVRAELQAKVKTHGAAAAMQELRARVADGTLTQRQVQNILKDDQTPALVKRFKGLPLKVAQDTYDAGTEREKKMWKAILDDKRARAGR